MLSESVKTVLISGAIGLIPLTLNLLDRRQGRASRQKASTERTAVTQWKELVENCQQRCIKLEESNAKLEEKLDRLQDGHEEELRQQRQLHEAEKMSIRDHHKIEIHEWQTKYVELEGLLKEKDRRVEYIESFLRRMGWVIPDAQGMGGA